MRKELLYREYCLKSYLNMSHYIIIDGRQGQTHPHTWEFITTIVVARDDFVEFRTFEELIEQYLEKYQDKILNTIEPFDTIVPTIENVTDYFDDELQELLYQNGCELISLEGSETPTRSYIISHRNEPEFIEKLGKMQNQRISDIVNYVVDEIAGGQNEKW